MIMHCVMLVKTNNYCGFSTVTLLSHSNPNAHLRFYQTTASVQKFQKRYHTAQVFL